MISTDALWGIVIAFLLQAFIVAFSYGRLTQKVSDLSKKLDNGWTCQEHNKLCSQVASNQAKADANFKRIDKLEKDNCS